MRVNIEQQTGEECRHRPAQRAPHPRFAEFKLALARDALGVGLQYADTAVEGQSDINPAEDAAEQDVNFEQIAKQHIGRAGEDQQNGNVPEQIFTQAEFVLYKAITHLREKRRDGKHREDNPGIPRFKAHFLVQPDREQRT